MFKRFVQAVTGSHNTKMVIIVRSDLNMGKGKIASQAAHAAVSLYASAAKSSSPHLKTWLFCGQPKVVLKVDSHAALTDLYDNAITHKLNACAIYDAGRTQLHRGTLTAVGFGPDRVEDVDELTKSLKLL
ncbi:hypothetical protein MTP99_008787 [Tenebrio molitor]|jgi:PTH2 family peptidyl-tRNA hydrolase|nr:hypothetical protein MTP99_008787 [Tenebrio molitor]